MKEEKKRKKNTVILILILIITSITVLTYVNFDLVNNDFEKMLYPDFDETHNIQFSTFKPPYNDTNKKIFTWISKNITSYPIIYDSNSLNCKFYMNFAYFQILSNIENTSLLYTHRIIVSNENNEFRCFELSYNYTKYHDLNNRYILFQSLKQTSPKFVLYFNEWEYCNPERTDIVNTYQIYRESDENNYTLNLFTKKIYSTEYFDINKNKTSSLILVYHNNIVVNLTSDDWYITGSSITINVNKEITNDNNICKFIAYQAFNGNPKIKIELTSPYNMVWYVNNCIYHRIGDDNLLIRSSRNNNTLNYYYIFSLNHKQKEKRNKHFKTLT